MSGTIQIIKHIYTNKIIEITFGKSLDNTSYSYEEARERMDGVLRSVNEKGRKIDFVVVQDNSVNYKQAVVSVDLYAINDQNELIKQYLSVQNRIRRGKTKLTPQVLDIGAGLMIDDASQKPSLRLEYSFIKPHTFATILSIDVVLKHQFDRLLHTIEGFQPSPPTKNRFKRES